VGGGRGVYGKENPRTPYAVGLPAEPARLVRGSSRRITIMRFRPANIRVINRRENRLDRDLRCFLSKTQEKEKQWIVVDGSFHIRGSEISLKRRHNARAFDRASVPEERFRHSRLADGFASGRF